MNTFTVTTDCGTTRTFDSRRDAEAGGRTHRELCDSCGENDVRIEATRESARGPTDPAGNGRSQAASAASVGRLPDGRSGSVRMDPLDVVPDYMIVEVEGQPTINKRGYAVIAHHFDIAVKAEAITTAGETDHEYAEFKATAWRKDDGPERGYTGHATARASEDRRGIADNLNEMAETRAMKRAVAWASGVGLLAWEEMAGHHEAE